jgi:membrane protease YdiL (CAAX protease family)
MKRHQRLFIFLLLVVALTCLISPWMAAGADWFGGKWPNLQPERYPFSRIFNRSFTFAGVILFFFCRRFLRIGKLSELGLPKVPGAGADFFIGWWIAVGSMVALGCVMSLAGVFTPYFRFSWSEAVGRCTEALFAGLSVGLLEEIFFRAILFKGLLADGNPARAFILGNLFYAAIHFVKPGEPYFLDGLEPLAGFRHLLSTFAPFLDPASTLPGVFGLFLLGVVLSYAYTRTDTLYLAIGLHAGWIFGSKTIRVFGRYAREDLGWMFGSTYPRIVSGAAAWVAIILVGIVVHRLTRERVRAGVDPLPPREASLSQRYARR